MNRIHLISSSVCLLGLVAPSTALAEKKPDIFAQYNVSHTGVLQPDEIAAIRKDYAANPDGPLKKYDVNHEGKLTDADIALIKPHKHKKKIKAGDESGAPAAPDAHAAPDKPATPDASAAPTSTSTVTTDKPTTTDAPTAAPPPATDSNGNK
jgi:hypothetical protein